MTGPTNVLPDLNSVIGKKRREYSEIADEMYALRAEAGARAVLKFCEYMINTIRVENDTVPAERLPYNQGQLSVLLKIQDALTVGLHRRI